MFMIELELKPWLQLGQLGLKIGLAYGYKLFKDTGWFMCDLAVITGMNVRLKKKP